MHLSTGPSILPTNICTLLCAGTILGTRFLALNKEDQTTASMDLTFWYDHYALMENWLTYEQMQQTLNTINIRIFSWNKNSVKYEAFLKGPSQVVHKRLMWELELKNYWG